MNVTGNYSVESRQRFMKQQLSALGYDQKFSADTLPLLENIVNDLLQTTDTLKHYKNLSNNCLQVRELVYFDQPFGVLCPPDYLKSLVASEPSNFGLFLGVP
jgi:hypothetical protein